MINNKYQQYQNNSVNTASPQELTLMLYNGAIRFCNQTIEAIENNDIEKSNNYNLKVQNIIVELQATLDDKYEIAKQFNMLYEFIKQLLIEGNMHKDKEKIVQAKEFIEEFRDLWKEIMKK